MRNSGKNWLLLLLSLVVWNINYAQIMESQLPKEKQTTPGLYVTAREAYEMWNANPQKIKILDVRTPDEYINIGHASMAWNIPAFIQTWNWDESKQHFSIKPSPDFMAQVREVFKNDDTILVTCRSGGRSAWAVNQLALAGYKNVYNIYDGMEGDTVDDPQSMYQGQRLKNGWKNSGLPWTYKVMPQMMKIPKNIGEINN
jgi:rhodanese-related sulfurtransferase